jgi:fatty acid desaturase
MTDQTRASDAEREQVAETLREHAATGRLDPDELEDRVGQALTARTRADLAPLVADLPTAPPKQRREIPRIPPVIPFAILLVAIWALTGAGYFWPMWPIGAMLIGALKHSGCRPMVTRRG